LKETLQLEDYEEEGLITLSGFKEAFQALGIDDDAELLDYLVFVVYARSDENLEQLRYGVLFELLGKKRPESSSPEKLKARNMDQ
jgi:Ca2+-binding EF-hand superfamily protein